MPTKLLAHLRSVCSKGLCAVLAIAGAATIALGLTLRDGSGSHDDQLTKIEGFVRSAYPDVAHLDPARLEELLASNRQDLVILDVREPSEWAVSRIPGSLRIPPRAWRTEVLETLGSRVGGKTVIFYCSVGVRSSKLAGRVQKALEQAGAQKVYNLSGGVFRWHNEGRPLVGEKGPTSYVHPYDSEWARYVIRQDKTTYVAKHAPEGSSP